MLVISRKPVESVMINNNIAVTVLGIKGKIVKLGITAPSEIPVHREEIYEKIKRQYRDKPADGNRDTDIAE